MKKRPDKGRGAAAARGLDLADEFDDFSAPASPRRGGAGGTAEVSAPLPQHMTGVSAAHFPPAPHSSAHRAAHDTDAEGKSKNKAGRVGGGAKSQQELLARVAQLEASLSAMGGGGALGSPTGGRSPQWRGEFKAKCHLEDDVRVLVLQRGLKVADLAETVAVSR
jgi:hypothetical protein